MITLAQAREMFAKMIAEKGEGYSMDQVFEIEFDDPIYVMTVIDKNGEQILPGRVFPAIRKRDGMLVDDVVPCPA